MNKLVALLLMSVFALTSQAQENEKAWSVSLDQSVLDKYVWRGLQFNEEGVNQGAIDLSYELGDLGTVGANVWYNLDMDSENGTAGEFSEVDYTLYWEKSFDGLTLGAGHIYYDFSEVNLGSTRELYVSAGFDAILAPSVTVYYDYEDVDGFYVDFSIGHSFDLSEGLTLDLGANLGWADDDQAEFYYGGSDSGFTNYAISAAVNYAVCENTTITPSLTYFGLLDDADDRAYEDDDFVFGVNVNYSF